MEEDPLSLDGYIRVQEKVISFRFMGFVIALPSLGLLHAFGLFCSGFLLARLMRIRCPGGQAVLGIVV